MFADAWNKHRQGLPLQPLEALIADIVGLHPEYHADLLDPDSAEREYTPEQKKTNPFLHMGLHIAVREQCTTDRPPGIADAMSALLARLGDAHAAEHVVLDCLAETLWEAQRSGRPPDDSAYLACVLAHVRAQAGVRT